MFSIRVGNCINLDFSNISSFGQVIAAVGGRFPLLGVVTPARLNPIIGGSRNASPVAVKFPAYVSVGSRVSVPRSGVIGARRRGGAIQAELKARRR
jgi:hypothetical protein